MTPIADILDRVLFEMAEAMDWPLDPTSRFFYRLADLLPAATVKSLILDACQAGILSVNQARRLIVALDLGAE